jgi:type I restriction enzyme S subunit
VNWPLVRVDSVSEINPRLPKGTDEAQEVSFLGMASVSEDGYLLDEELRVLSDTKKGFTYFAKGDVLLAKITPCFENGKCLRPNQITNNIGFGSTEFHVIRASEEHLDSKYLFYMLWSDHFRLYGRSSMSGAAGQKRVSADFIKGYQIPLPPLKEQKRIAAILDKADNLRLKRQQAIQLADEFLRAVFLDMFGDPVTNPNGFDLRMLGEFYCDKKNGTKCGPFGSALKKGEYVGKGVPVWNMGNITLKGDFIDEPSLWITEQKFRDLEGYSVSQGDVIISRAGTVGKMGVVRSKDTSSIISTNLIRVRFGKRLLPEYFVCLMTYCKGRVGRLKTGPDGAFTHMNTGILDNLEFPYPSIDLQRKYLAIRSGVLSVLNSEGGSSNHLSRLFNSISQKAFSGHL